MWGFIGGACLGALVGVIVMSCCQISGCISSQEEADAVRALLAQSEELKEAIDER